MKKVKDVRLLLLITISLLVLLSNCASTNPGTVKTSSVSEKPIEFNFKPYTGTGDKPKVSVLPFTNDTPFESKVLGKGVSNTLVTALVKSRHFTVIERDRLQRIVDEQSLSMSGILDSESSIKAGKILGIDYIITGSITEFGVKNQGTSVGYGGSTSAAVGVKKGIARIVIDIRVIDIETGGIIWADTGIGSHFSTNIGLAFEEITLMSGIQGFDETLAGKATRKSVYNITNKLISENL